jgi:TRAP-type C4-dicarboxylate transport system permease small subunit
MRAWAALEEGWVRRLGPLEWGVFVLMLALVVVVFSQVALRYLTYQPLAWTEEVARYAFIWLSLLGAAVGGRRGVHFAVDLLPRRLPPRAGRMLRAGIRLTEVGFYGLLAWSGLQIVRVTHLQRSASIDLPMSIPYAAIPVAALLLCLFSLRQAAGELRATLR